MKLIDFENHFYDQSLINALLERGLAQEALRYLDKAGAMPEADNARGAALLLLVNPVVG